MGTRAARALTLHLPAARPSRHRAGAAMSAPVVGFAIRVARKLKAIDVIDVLSDLFILRGVTAHIRSDNGPEFVAKAARRLRDDTTLPSRGLRPRPVGKSSECFRMAAWGER